jgi:hypothetical protein
LPPLLSGIEEYSENLILYESMTLDPSTPPPRIS